jgi:regulator of protease activity HflC (stomatin/prohibitin superfamily)
LIDSAPRHGSSTTAGEEAAVLEAGGQRTAAALLAGGTLEADILRTAGQRRVNLIWEVTQAVIAMLVVGITLTVAALAAREGMRGTSQQAISTLNSAITMLSNSLFLVIGFYFGRTNHQRVGGVGQNDIGR